MSAGEANPAQSEREPIYWLVTEPGSYTVVSASRRSEALLHGVLKLNPGRFTARKATAEEVEEYRAAGGLPDLPMMDQDNA